MNGGVLLGRVGWQAALAPIGLGPGYMCVRG